jgi:tetratricopeptide (TPR) repeat protein
MKRLASRLLVSLLTFALGLASSSLWPRPSVSDDGWLPPTPPSALSAPRCEAEEVGGHDDAASLDRQGNSLRARGCFEEAAVAYSAAIAADPSYATAYDDLANAQNFLGRYDETLDTAARGLRVSPDDAFLANELGYAYRALGRYREAVGAFNRAARAEPDNAFAHATAGGTYFKLGRYEEASTEARRGIELGTRDGDDAALANAGSALAALGRLREAADILEQARDIAPGEPGHHLELGCVYELEGRRAEADASFARAVEQEPVTPYDYLSRAWAYLYLGEGRAAASAARDYLGRVGWRGHDAPYAAMLAYVAYRQSGEPSEAALILEEAAERCEQSAWAQRLFRYLRHEATAGELIAAAGDEDERIDAHTFVGLETMLDGRGREAAVHLRWARDHAAQGDWAYAYLRRQLNVLEPVAGD